MLESSALVALYIRMHIPRCASSGTRRRAEANLRKRGFDFAFATLIFDGPTLEKQDRRRNYGEVRVLATGLADEIALTVVYTDRFDDEAERVRRIISARRSNRRERKAYQAAIEKAE
jgi:uncharacterized DUF497 family protein